MTIINNEIAMTMVKESPFELANVIEILKFHLIDKNYADFDGTILDERSLEDGFETRNYYFAPDFILDFGWMLSMTTSKIYDACCAYCNS